MVKGEIREHCRCAQNNRGDIVFYDKFAQLCKAKGVSPSRAALDAGISKSLVSKWRTNNTEYPSPEIAKKIAAYFNISVADLLDEETKKSPVEPMLNEGEKMLLDLFRQIPEDRQQVVIAMIKAALDK